MAFVAKDVKASKHGVKTALLLTQDNSRINATFREGCTAAFEPSSMEESSTRLTADPCGNDEFISFFDSIDDKVVSLLVAESSTFFGKTLGYEDVGKFYVPCVKRKGDYAPWSAPRYDWRVPMPRECGTRPASPASLPRAGAASV